MSGRIRAAETFRREAGRRRTYSVASARTPPGLSTRPISRIVCDRSSHAAEVLDGGQRVGDVERAIPEGEPPAVHLHEGQMIAPIGKRRVVVRPLDDVRVALAALHVLPDAFVHVGRDDAAGRDWPASTGPARVRRRR